MGVSIYYTSTRDKPLTPKESKAIEAIEEQYSVTDEIDAYLKTGEGLNWEDFSFYEADPETPDVILDGSVKLPDNTDEAPIVGIQHWRTCLTEIRRAIPDAEWSVRLDETDFDWDEQSGWSLPGFE